VHVLHPQRQNPKGRQSSQASGCVGFLPPG
jgi:hypothetical protein